MRKEARLRDGLQRSARAGALREPTVYVLSGQDYIAEMRARSGIRLDRDLLVSLEVPQCRNSTRACVLSEMNPISNCGMSRGNEN